MAAKVLRFTDTTVCPALLTALRMSKKKPAELKSAGFVF
jgi:hypothetical protein